MQYIEYLTRAHAQAGSTGVNAFFNSDMFSRNKYL
jgi:hypothetical protein